MGILERIDKPGFASSKEFATELATGIKEEISSSIQPLLQEIKNLKAQIASGVTTPSSAPAPTPVPTPVSGSTPTPTPTPTPSITTQASASIFAFTEPVPLSSGGTLYTPASVNVSGSATTSPTGVITYQVGSSVTVDITGLDPNVTFDSWRQDSVNGEILSGITPYTLTVPEGGLTLVAVFKEAMLAGTGGGGGGGGGTSTGTGGTGGVEFNPVRLFT